MGTRGKVLGTVRAKRLDFETYEPHAAELIGAAVVADELGMRVHSVLRAIRQGRLWAINLSAVTTRANYFTTWRAVADWTTSGRYTGPQARTDA